jgi:hypothetical protein
MSVVFDARDPIEYNYKRSARRGAAFIISAARGASIRASIVSM